jgi:hypothetical protein
MKVFNDTTNNANRADVLAPSYDDALTVLYGQYRSALAADLAFERAAAAEPDKRLAERLYARARGHRDRADLLAEALCSVPADGLRGALVQVRVLLDLENSADGDRFDRALVPVLISVGSVLRGATDRGDALRPATANVTETDPSAIAADWHAIQGEAA